MTTHETCNNNVNDMDTVKSPLVNLDLPILGMSCAGCASSLEKALTGTEGIESVDVSFGSRSAHVVYDRVVATPLLIRNAVVNAGFEVGVVERLYEVSGLKSESHSQELEGALLKTEGVITAEVRFDTKTVIIQLVPEAASLGQLREVARSLGSLDITPCDTQKNWLDLGRENEHRETRSLRRALLVSTLCTSLLLLIAMVPGWLALDRLSPTVRGWIQLVLATPIVV